MRILPVNTTIYNRISNRDGIRNNPFRTKTSFDTVSFGNENLVWDYTYPYSLEKHQYNIERTSPAWVEDYFGNMSIPASFKDGDDYSNKLIAFCCFHAAEIFKQLNLQLPAKISFFDFGKLNDPGAETAVGVCLISSRPDLNMPLRSVGFNTYEDEDLVRRITDNVKDTHIGSENFPIKYPTSYWKNHFIIQKDAKRSDFGTTGHFLHPFIHEFCHNLHFHNIFSKYGCFELNPNYRYNPGARNIISAMSVPLKDDYGRDLYHPVNSFVSPTARSAMKDSSRYGATLLPELFAEEMTKAILSNIDLFSLRLKRNILPFATQNPALNSVLYEVYNGLVADNDGLV